MQHAGAQWHAKLGQLVLGTPKWTGAPSNAFATIWQQKTHAFLLQDELLVVETFIARSYESPQSGSSTQLAVPLKQHYTMLTTLQHTPCRLHMLCAGVCESKSVRPRPLRHARQPCTHPSMPLPTCAQALDHACTGASQA
jgi:hypothetical protein